MHGGRQLFSSTLLVELEGRLLKQWVALYVLATVWRKGETHARARLPRWAGRGVAWVHDLHVNGPSKSEPKPGRSAASFYLLFLLRVRV
jgi:hypothetical protein